MLQMHGICMDTSLTEPEILSAQNSATVAVRDLLPLVPCHSLSGLCEQALELVLH